MILFQDEALLVVNKPAGLPVLPDGYHPELPYLRGLLEVEFGRLWVVHRLDKETSGVIVLARTAEAHRHLNRQFEGRQVSKVYHALATGSPGWEEKSFSLPLRPDGDRRHRTVPDPRRGKTALTDFRVLDRFEGCTLLEAIPRTGRTHQIRAHLVALGLPILGDALYGGGEGLQLPGDETADAWLMHRMALHARSLELLHPSTGLPVRFEAPYPDDLAAALEHLRGLPDQNC